MKPEFPSPEAGVRSRRKDRQRLRPGYWLWSLLVHGALLVWLFFFSPVRVIDLQSRQREYTAGSEKIERVMDYIRERRVDLLQPQVRELLSLQRELNELAARKKEEFTAFLNDFSDDAQAKAMAAQAAAEKAQAEALAAQEAAQKALAEAVSANVTSAWASAAAAQKEAQDAQWRARQSMEKALQTLALGGAGFSEAGKSQQEANDLQTKADKAQLDANSAREESKDAANNLQRKTESLAKTETSLQAAQQDAADAQARVRDAKSEYEKRQGDYEAAAAAWEAAKLVASQSGLSKEEQKSLKAQENNAKSAASQAMRQANDAKSKQTNAEKAADKAKLKVQQSQEKLDQAQAEQQQAQSKAADALKNAGQTQAVAAKLQNEALQAQARARQTTANAGPGTRVAGADAPSWQGAAIDGGAALEVSGLDLAGLYETAVKAETALTEIYREVRATDLAMIRQIPLPQARHLTEVAKPVRPDLAGQLRQKVSSGEGVADMRQTVQTAANEINSMVALGHSLLATAKGFDSAMGTNRAGVSLEGIYARAGQAELMNQLAAEDPRARAKDLADAMTGKGTGQGDGGGKAGKPGASGDGPGGGGGAGGAGRFGRPLEPPVVPKDLRALPSRKIASYGQPAQWVYVDSWYILGPFDNAGRVNIEKKFPPETVVDLDATYIGKDNQPIRWEFFQTGQPRVTPPFSNFRPERKAGEPMSDVQFRGLEYIIYYAYTELYFERAQDLWVAVGSDDYSKVWIEDQLIWASGKQQKSWQVDEGFRRVHFKQGINRILYRVENGWRGTDFSFSIHLGNN